MALRAVAGAHQAIAAAGYAVVLPNPRGSSSYGQAFTSACVGDWGGADYEDILACCDDVIERGVADGERMFVSGGSYGGFMTSWIVGHSDRFRAAAGGGGRRRPDEHGAHDRDPRLLRVQHGRHAVDGADEYEKRSPLTTCRR